ncbi:MAG: glycosyltransferase [Acidobacteria bacterium]|nr:glycosyltransferase [Acidobacteriota bacterium]
MKSLHLTNNYHAASGGISTFYRAMLETAEELRWSMCLVVPGEKDHIEEPGRYTKIIQLRAPRTPFFDRRYRLLLPHKYMSPFHTRLRRILADEKPDLVEICDKYTLIYLAGFLQRGWIPGVPRPATVGISCERMDDNVRTYISESHRAQRFCRWYMSEVYYRMFRHHIAVSDYTAAELRATPRGREAPHKITILPMGVSTRHFLAAGRNPDIRRQLLLKAGAHSGAALLVYAGRLAREKNLDLLCDTMTELARDAGQDYRLLIAGGGPRTEWLKGECQRRIPGKMVFLGHIQDPRVLAQVLANCDVFLHPNPCEPFGIAPLEAMAAGLPLVAPAAGGVLSYADRSNSWVTDPSGRSFAAAVRHILQDDGQRQEKGRCARLTAARFDWRSVTESYFATYEAWCTPGFSGSRAAVSVSVPERLSS